MQNNYTKSFLHVGCGAKNKLHTTREFKKDYWKEVRLDIDASVAPDIVASMTDISHISGNEFDAIFSSHNIEHLYAYEVVAALKEFNRLLKDDGILVITCPDLQSIAKLVAEDKLLDTAYTSPAGPIAPIDMLYGLRSALAQGNHFMAHRCGFTEKVLRSTITSVGFLATASMARSHPFYDLWVIACKSRISEDAIRQLAMEHFP